MSHAFPRNLVTGPTRWRRLIVIFLTLGVFGLAVSEIHSFDVFWQLHTGRHMVATGEVLRNDTFSLAADRERYEHCWLHDVVLHGAHYVGGFAGLSVLKGLLAVTTFVLLLAGARRRGASWPATIFVSPTLMALTYGAWMARPQLWSFLFTALFLFLLARRRERPWRTAVALGAAMLAWANLHAGAALALPIVGAYVAGDLLESVIRRKSSPPLQSRLALVCGLLLVVVAGLLTPYGTRFYSKVESPLQLGGSRDAAAGAAADTPTAAAAMERAQRAGPLRFLFNMDWRHTSYTTDREFYLVMGAAALVLLLAWRRVALADLILLAGLAFVGTRLSRHTTFFFLATATVLPPYLDAVIPVHWSRAWTERFRVAAGRVVLMLGVVLAIVTATPAATKHGLFGTGLRTWHYPVAAAEFVARERLPGNLYNTYDWGGYLMWRLYPEHRVFWDGRSSSAEMFDLGYRVMSAVEGWEEILARFEVETVVTKACAVATGQHYPVIDALRSSEDWRLVFADHVSLVFVRKDAVTPAFLRAHRVPDARIDDAILSEATLLVNMDPTRFAGWWEIGRILFQRKQYAAAIEPLRRHLELVPVRNPYAERYLEAALRAVGR